MFCFRRIVFVFLLRKGTVPSCLRSVLDCLFLPGSGLMQFLLQGRAFFLFR